MIEDSLRIELKMDASRYIQFELIYSVWKHLEKVLSPILDGESPLSTIVDYDGRGAVYCKANAVHVKRITVVEYFGEIVSVFRNLCLQNARQTGGTMEVCSIADDSIARAL